MKTVSVALGSHLALEVTTLATCWRLIRRDGVELFFTDHDKNLIVDGDEYLSAVGYSRTAIENDLTMGVDNLDVMGFLDNEAITEIDLRAGAYDFAEVYVFIVNWDDLSQGILKQRRGRLGEVTMSENGVFHAELRGMTQQLSQVIGEVYSPECRADLGDSRCKVPIQPDVIQRSTDYTLGEFVRVATLEGSNVFASEVYENRIYEVTRAGHTGDTEPVFDTTPGNDTTDTDVKASGLLTFTGQPGNGQSATIGTKIYLFQTVLTNVDGHVLIGATFQISVANLLAAMTLGAGAGTAYAAATTAHTTVDFSANGVDKIDLLAKVAGDDGNSIATTEVLSNASFGATTLTGGFTGAIFTARESWSRSFEVIDIIDRFTIAIAVDEVRAVEDWFTGGGLIFETGDNAGRLVEVKEWPGDSFGSLTLFLPTPYEVQLGDLGRIYPGCDKKLQTCIDKFNNVLNFRGEPYIPGQDDIIKYPDAK